MLLTNQVTKFDFLLLLLGRRGPLGVSASPHQLVEQAVVVRLQFTAADVFVAEVAADEALLRLRASDAAHAAERELAVQVRTCAAPPADLLELTARLDAGAVVTPAAPPPAPALVLDQIDREELARSCASKGRYPSEVDAKRKARECEAKRGQPLRVYLCWPGCGGWHLTSRLEVPDHVRDRQAR